MSYRGNRYSVPPHLHGTTVTVHARLGATYLDIATSSAGPGRDSPVPTIVARHLIAPTGAGATIRDDGHVTALTAAALAAFTTAPPHRRKERRPPTAAALAEAEQLRTRTFSSGAGGLDDRAGRDAVIDLARYAAAATGRNTFTTQGGDSTMTKETNTQ